MKSAQYRALKPEETILPGDEVYDHWCCIWVDAYAAVFPGKKAGDKGKYRRKINTKESK
jgi:hypothetical protein